MVLDGSQIGLARFPVVPGLNASKVHVTKGVARGLLHHLNLLLFLLCRILPRLNVAVQVRRELSLQTHNARLNLRWSLGLARLAQEARPDAVLRLVFCRVPLHLLEIGIHDICIDAHGQVLEVLRSFGAASLRFLGVLRGFPAGIHGVLHILLPILRRLWRQRFARRWLRPLRLAWRWRGRGRWCGRSTSRRGRGPWFGRGSLW
mmetsp:Transcript_9034/g.28753  ORF Transcript_9034/g.28753 Transcript_9034/m.28753 type:complete len:204 (-) Transcript_9034:106-717(-)